jgi:glutamine cyclotransferase
MTPLRLLFLPALFLCSCSSQPTSPAYSPPAEPAIPSLNYSVRHVYPHDTTSYTEGFLFHDRHFFESSGAPDELPQTRSIVGIVDAQSGRIDKKIELDKKVYFGEGIAFFKDKLYQLTYKNKTGFIYDAKTYKQLNTFKFKNKEGWALTNDSLSLIMSDGTSSLTFLDPANLKPVRVLMVTQSGVPLDSLNELEYIKGYIYANRFTQNYVVKIDPSSGKVVARIDLSSLVNAEKTKNPNTDVLNGIAYDPATDKIYVTGKLWSGIYEIDFSH